MPEVVSCLFGLRTAKPYTWSFQFYPVIGSIEYIWYIYQFFLSAGESVPLQCQERMFYSEKILKEFDVSLLKG